MFGSILPPLANSKAYFTPYAPMGAYGVKYALELANGGSIDPNIDTGTQLVTKENANDFK